MTNKYLEKIAKKLSDKEVQERGQYIAKHHKGKLLTGVGLAAGGGAVMGSGLADKLFISGGGNKRLLVGAGAAATGVGLLHHLEHKVNKKFDNRK